MTQQTAASEEWGALPASCIRFGRLERPFGFIYDFMPVPRGYKARACRFGQRAAAVCRRLEFVRRIPAWPEIGIPLHGMKSTFSRLDGERFFPVRFQAFSACVGACLAASVVRSRVASAAPAAVNAADTP